MNGHNDIIGIIYISFRNMLILKKLCNYVNSGRNVETGRAPSLV